MSYISAARSLLSGDGYILFDGSPFFEWPPLFPTALAVLGFGVIDPLDVGRYFNAVLLGMTIFFSGLWILRLGSIPMALLGSVAILLSKPLITVSSHIWSEPLFDLLVVLFMLEMDAFIRSARRRSLLILSVIAALACLTRYIGVTFVLTGVALVLMRRNAPVGNKLLDATLFGSLSFMPLAAWIARNYLVTSSFLGERGFSQYWGKMDLMDTKVR